MKEAQPYCFSVVELAKDRGLIGQVLRPYEDLLRAADRWAEQNGDCTGKQKILTCLPCLDPWQFLLDAPAISTKSKAICRAAQSQAGALRHLLHIAQGIATLNTDWSQKAAEARIRGDEVSYNHAVRKIANAQVINARVQEHVREQGDPELLKQMKRFWTKRRAQLVHRGRGREVIGPNNWPPWKEFAAQNKLPLVLVEWWVRCGPDGAPGLMFWRNEALTKFLKIHLDQSNLHSAEIKKVRQQLGLLPVGDKQHFVWDVSIKIDRRNNREIQGYQRNGDKAFSGVISPQKKISDGVLLSVS